MECASERCPGLYTTVGNKQDGELLNPTSQYKFPADYKFVLDGKLCSPWYDNECDRSAERATDRPRTRYQLSPNRVGRSFRKTCSYLTCGVGPTDRGRVGNISTMTTLFIVPQNGGRLRLWILPNGDDQWDFTNDEFVIGCDIATGKGGRLSSNSSASVFNKRTRSKVAHFWSNSINPIDFAQYCFCLGRFFTRKARSRVIIPEANGPGASSSSNSSGLNIRTCSSGNRKRSSRRKDERTGLVVGKTEKRILLSNYVKELRPHDYQPCIESLKECEEYEQTPDGEHFPRRGQERRTASTRAKITAIW